MYEDDTDPECGWSGRGNERTKEATCPWESLNYLQVLKTAREVVRRTVQEKGRHLSGEKIDCFW